TETTSRVTRLKAASPNLENLSMNEETPVKTSPALRSSVLKAPVLRAIGLSKKVTSPEGPLTILDQANLQIEQGETIAIVGASGAGKSTLLGLLAGLDVPTEGEVWLDG